MTKTELINELVASNIGDNFPSKAKTKRLLNTILNTIKATTARGENVTIHKFGTFTVIDTKGRTGVSPTGTKYTSKPSKLPKFRASTTYKKEVQQ